MSRGYRGYRGGRRSVGFLIPTLVVLCVIAAFVLFYLQKNLAFTPDGMQLKLPFTDNTINFGGGKSEDVPLVVEQEEQSTDAVKPEEKEEPKVPETPAVPEYETRVENSVFLPRDVVLDPVKLDTAITALDGTQINTVILEVKAESGLLSFHASSELAADVEINTTDNAVLTAALTKIKDKGLQAVAQMSAFRDNRMAKRNQPLACRTKKKVIWLDRNNITWLNPYIPEARGYLTSLISDLYAIGFREVLLTNISFPVRGKVNLLYYPQKEETTMQEAVKTFLNEVKTLAESKEGLYVSVKYDDLATNENPAPGGQTLDDLINSSFRIYADVTVNKDGTVDQNLYDMLSKKITDGRFVNRFVPRLRVDGLDNEIDIPSVITAMRSRGNGASLYQEDGKYKSIVPVKP